MVSAFLLLIFPIIFPSMDFIALRTSSLSSFTHLTSGFHLLHFTVTLTDDFTRGLHALNDIHDSHLYYHQFPHASYIASCI